MSTSAIEKFNNIVKTHGLKKYLKRWIPARQDFSIQRSLETYHFHSFIEKSQKKAAIKQTYRKPVMRIGADEIAYVSIATDHEKLSIDVNNFLNSSELIRGLIIDFRQHLGGSFWPVVECFKRYFNNSSLIKFNAYWINLQNEKIVFGKTFLSATIQHIPIAILIGPQTKSSGEISAALFKGRPNCRIFGQKTNGKLSCNQPYSLDKKETLWLTTGLVTTYDKHLQDAEIVNPDVITTCPMTDAKNWIKRV